MMAQFIFQKDRKVMRGKCPRYLDAGLPVCLCDSVQIHTRSIKKLILTLETKKKKQAVSQETEGKRILLDF